MPRKDLQDKNRLMGELLHKGITDRILGSFYQVHRELGPGYLESVYARGMEWALLDEGLRVEREVPVSVYFRGRQVGVFRADMIVESVVLLEFKAGDGLIHLLSRNFSTTCEEQGSNLVSSCILVRGRRSSVAS